MYQIGDYIEFNLPGSDNKNHSSSDFKGKVIVLYTYPRDNTPGCTVEANGFKTLYEAFEMHNTVILGLNNNSLSSHQKFIDKYFLPFKLLVDKDLELIEALGAKKEETKVYRKTFIVDEEGRLEKVYDQVSTKTHGQEVLDYIISRKKI